MRILFKHLTAQEMLDQNIDSYVYINPGIVTRIVIFVLAALWLQAGTKVAVEAYNQRITCSIFSTRIEAQRAFDSDPVRYQVLDRDRDGKACE